MPRCGKRRKLVTRGSFAAASPRPRRAMALPHHALCRQRRPGEMRTRHCRLIGSLAMGRPSFRAAPDLGFRPCRRRVLRRLLFWPWRLRGRYVTSAPLGWLLWMTPKVASRMVLIITTAWPCQRRRLRLQVPTAKMRRATRRRLPRSSSQSPARPSRRQQLYRSLVAVLRLTRRRSGRQRRRRPRPRPPTRPFAARRLRIDLADRRRRLVRRRRPSPSCRRASSATRLSAHVCTPHPRARGYGTWRRSLLRGTRLPVETMALSVSHRHRAQACAPAHRRLA